MEIDGYVHAAGSMVRGAGTWEWGAGGGSDLISCLGANSLN